MTRILHTLHHLWTRLTTSITRTGRRVYLFLRGSLERISDRWDGDHGFRRTLTSAITAITTTAIPNVALAAGIAAFLAEQPARIRRPAFDRFDYDEEDDEPWRPATPSRLWDSLT